MGKIEYQLTSEFVDADLELAVLDTLRARPAWAMSWAAKVGAKCFVAHAECFARFQNGEFSAGKVRLSEEDFLAAIQKLTDLARRRELAQLQEDLASLLFDENVPVADALALLEKRLDKLRRSATQPLRMESAFELGREVLDWVDLRQAKRKETGNAVMGMSTGLASLDRLTNGWYPGLHVIAAGPGAGKTTLCLQFAWQAASAGYPVVFVTYENAAKNLLLKLLCSRASVAAGEIERGYGEPAKLREVHRAEQEVFRRLHFIEGDGRLRVSQVEDAMRLLYKEKDTLGEPQGLVVFDYLQRAAHSLGYEQLRQNVSLLTAELRELAMRLDCPLLAISSQNRAGGDYGKGGSGALDSLKESGDLEYGADTVSLLYYPNDNGNSLAARELEMKLAKNRFGPCGSLRLIFRPDLGVFREKL
jgi:replicative DNA helicase